MLLSLLLTFVGQIIASFGFAFVSYVGLDLLQQQFLNWMVGALNGIPSDALQIFYMSGGGDFLNWIFGGFVFVISTKTTSAFLRGLKRR